MTSLSDTIADKKALIELGALISDLELLTEPSRADIKCSPKCGFGCTQAAYDRALAEATALALRLGDRWEVHVWENCGWRYQVRRGCVEISPRTKGNAIKGTWTVTGYTCFIQTTPQFIGDGETPDAAFRCALSKMQAVFDDLTASIGDVREMITGAATLAALDKQGE